MALFQPGTPKQGGRAKGVRNKLSHTFLNDLLEEWNAHGKEALRIMRMEDPVRFSIMVGSLLPKEMTIEVGPLQEISDDQLTAYLEYADRQLTSLIGSIEGRASTEADGEPSCVLQAIPKAT